MTKTYILAYILAQLLCCTLTYSDRKSPNILLVPITYEDINGIKPSVFRRFEKPI